MQINLSKGNMFRYLIISMLIIGTYLENLNAQEAISLAEKYYLHTDRNNYVAGEDIQFKVYSLIGQKNKPVTLSKAIYINLVDENGTSHVQQKLLINNNGAFGTVKIPKDVNSGYYRLYAYTKWQRNFGLDAYTFRRFFIINPDEGVKYATENNKINLFFIPEGDVLITGIKNRVVFYCKNEYGELIPCKGKIKDSRDSIVTKFESTKNGIGEFILNPVESLNYKALVNYNDKILSFNLPSCVPSGYRLSLNNTSNNYVNLNLKKKGQIDACKIDVKFNGFTYMNLADLITEDNFTLTVPKNKFIPGLNNVVLKNQKDEVIFEQPFIHNNKEHVSFDVRTDKTIYSKRAKVTVNIKSYLQQHYPKSASISVSVTRLEDQTLNSIQNSFNNIVTTKYLNSGIVNELDNLSESLEDLQKKCNIYSLFDKPISTCLDSIHYIPESKGAYISGIVTEKYNDEPVFNRFIILVTTFDSLRTTKVISTDNEGRFLSLFDYSTEFSEVLFQFKEKTDADKYKIQFDNDFETSFPADNKKILKFKKDKEDYLKRLMLNYQLSEQYATYKEVVKPQTHLSHLFYGIHDSSYVLSKYIDLPTMEEVFNNLVINVTVKKNKHEYEILVFNAYKRQLNFPVLILVDGIPVTDLAAVMKTPPSKIEKIVLINTNYLIGNTVFGGIISLFSKENDFAGIKLPKSAQIIDYENFINKQEFKNRIPDQIKDKHYPHFKNTLYWNPNFTTDNNGDIKFSFYTGDETGKFIIRVEGITNEGIPGAGYSVFEIKK